MHPNYSPIQPTGRRAFVIGAVALGFVAVTLLDPALQRLLVVEDRTRLESREWYQMLRQVGYVPTYIAGALAMTLVALRRAGRRLPTLDDARPGILLMLSVLLSGGAGEALKLIIGRSRPLGGTEYDFRPFLSDFFDGTNLGMPASHAVIAFAGAFALARLYPGCGPVVIALAAGCGLSRVLPGAHFASDVYGAGVVAYTVTGAVFAVSARIEARRAARRTHGAHSGHREVPLRPRERRTVASER
jgi:membrane-associated phospholipid phosphatase